jgi:tRNA threonylcarbamoyladenosine biosynthesis protein TsaB
MILGIDTSGKNLGLALCDGGSLAASFLKTTGLKHGEILEMEVQGFLEANGAALNSLSGIAVTLGPGSFTGLRIGLAAAKGYAYALNIPMAGVSTLLAAATAYRNYSKKVLTVLDARRGEIYTATFDCSSELPRRLSPDLVGKFDDLTGLNGDDMLIFWPSMFEEQPRLKNSQWEYAINDDYNMAEGAACLGEIELLSGRQLDVALAVPSYLRHDFMQA